MSTITDTDLQQLKDLIVAGQMAAQQQFADLDKKMEVGFANVDTKFAKLEGKIDTINAELEGIKSNQKGQDTRFWSLVFLVLAALIGIVGRFVKVY